MGPTAAIAEIRGGKRHAGYRLNFNLRMLKGGPCRLANGL
jgi:hypothetical protein